MLTYFNPQTLARRYNDYQFPDEKTESQKSNLSIIIAWVNRRANTKTQLLFAY